MKAAFRFLVVLSSVYLMITGFAVGQVPQLINYQGVLVDPATGQPVPDDTYSITFSIYDVASGGSPTWTESQSVQTKDGLYSVLLGSTTTLTSAILSGTEKYLGIKVGADPEMTPRKRIVSVAYAIVSATADGLGDKAAAEYAVKSELSTSDGDPPNEGSNQVSWDNLNDVPAGFADGVDDVGIGGDNLGNHTAMQNLNLNGHWLSGDGDGEGVYISNEGKVGIGTTTPNEQLEITGNFRLPATTATTGVIKSDGNRFIHSFGSTNVFAGINAGNLSMSGGNNAGVGNQTLQNNTTGDGNTATGAFALASNTTGYTNTAIGTYALFSNQSGNSNTATGAFALQQNTGSGNTATGDAALILNQSGHSNTATGLQALQYNITGIQNTAVGVIALGRNESSNNTAVGYGALFHNTTGFLNTAVGFEALQSNVTGFNNTAIGRAADVLADNLTNATAIGANAKVATSNSLVLGGTGSDAVNVGIGTTSPTSQLHVVGEGIVTEREGGPYLRFIDSLPGNKNWVLQANAPGTYFRIRNETDNVDAIYIDTDGSFGIGMGPGYGSKLSVGGNANFTGNVGFGMESSAFAYNILTVVQNSSTDPIADAWTTYSSKRWKTNIKPIDGALDKVSRLRGVCYDWKADGKHDIGLIAEEVGEVIPEVVAYEENGEDAKSIDYARLVAVLIEANKELRKEIEQQKRINKKQKTTIDDLSTRILNIEKTIGKSDIKLSNIMNEIQ